MTIITTTVSVDYRYLVGKSKERLISLYQQLSGKRLSGDEYRAMQLKRQRELVDIVWKIWSELPDDTMPPGCPPK